MRKLLLLFAFAACSSSPIALPAESARASVAPEITKRLFLDALLVTGFHELGEFSGSSWTISFGPPQPRLGQVTWLRTTVGGWRVNPHVQYPSGGLLMTVPFDQLCKLKITARADGREAFTWQSEGANLVHRIPVSWAPYYGWTSAPPATLSAVTLSVTPVGGTEAVDWEWKR